MLNDGTPDILNTQIALARALRQGPVDVHMTTYMEPAIDVERCSAHQAKQAMRPVWQDWIMSYLAGIPKDTEQLRMQQYATMGIAEWMFCTLTFDDNPDGSPPGLQRVRKAAERWMAGRGWKQIVDVAVTVMERGDANGRLHLHSVLRIKDGVHVGSAGANLVGTWQNGHVVLELAKNPAHVANYISKYMTKSMDEPESSDFWMYKSERFK